MCHYCRERESSGIPSSSPNDLLMGSAGIVVRSNEVPNIEVTPPSPQWIQTPKKPDRLYCLPMSEQMHATIAELYERDIEANYDPDEEVSVEVWTVTDNHRWMPKIDRILDEISTATEGLEVNEYWWEKFQTSLGHPETRTKVAELRNVIASKIDFWMADKHVDTLTLKINGGFPLVDGKPVYKREPIR